MLIISESQYRLRRGPGRTRLQQQLWAAPPVDQSLQSLPFPSTDSNRSGQEDLSKDTHSSGVVGCPMLSPFKEAFARRAAGPPKGPLSDSRGRDKRTKWIVASTPLHGVTWHCSSRRIIAHLIKGDSKFEAPLPMQKPVGTGSGCFKATREPPLSYTFKGSLWRT
ncbi:hypothetical protein BCV69DRAFT_177772 [Microstroma glucosiphilum]|uniref:Uncharacterized protein n=1 Tax=Pseudomicrostroma glucosiphilum TaxID=1684307 RepID=A0A316U918_9BASI|nr:hypothetical protein BCV69DRAFT_177772 [Pseudomicrostroma glucosiphilum]PWN20873.1 hypothetical protein BCV69DRAFT_177772 [Pseudomicrostroma glucosiphilum]